MNYLSYDESLEAFNKNVNNYVSIAYSTPATTGDNIYLLNCAIERVRSMKLLEDHKIWSINTRPIKPIAIDIMLVTQIVVHPIIKYIPSRILMSEDWQSYSWRFIMIDAIY